MNVIQFTKYYLNDVALKNCSDIQGQLVFKEFKKNK